MRPTRPDRSAADDADVPDLVAAMAEKMTSYGFGARESASMVRDMLREAIDDSDTFYADQFDTRPYRVSHSR